MARNLPPKFGIEGEFYVEGGDERSGDVIDFNRSPRTQPGLWCQWTPTSDNQGIEWDGDEKFYAYVEWLRYIIVNFLAPKNYVLNGQVSYHGDDATDSGIIVVKDNVAEKREVGTLSDRVNVLESKVQAVVGATPLFTEVVECLSHAIGFIEKMGDKRSEKAVSDARKLIESAQQTLASLRE